VINAKTASVSAGDITFKLHNAGGFDHEMVVFKMGSMAAMPLASDGTANEDAVPEGQHMGEIDPVKPGATRDLKMTLTPGKYVLFCNKTTSGVHHFEKNMATTFTVTA